MTSIKTTLFSAGFLAMACASAVHAQTPAATAPAATSFDVSYNIGVVSDYRYRGVSQTVLKPAIQGGLDATYGGAYFGLWASNIKWLKDAGNEGNVEVDVYGGYKFALGKDLMLDVGVLRYQYPRNDYTPNANTTEVYLGLASGPYSAKYSQSTTNLFGYSNSKNSAYLEANLDLELVKGTNLVAHVGRQKVNNNGYYTDYKLGVTYEALGGKFSGAVVGTNVDILSVVDSKNTSKAGLVVGYTKTF